MKNNEKTDSDIDESGNDVDKNSRRNISKKESVFLAISDVLMLTTILLDVSYLGNMGNINRQLLLAINIIMVIFSYINYQMKKRIRKRMSWSK
jgi:uncharacterized membrane protein